MRQVWSVLATKAIIDMHSNMISIIDVCDQLNVHAPDLPTFNNKSKRNLALSGLSLQLITMWYRTDYKKAEKGLSRVTIKTPDGKRFLQPEREIGLQSVSTARVILAIDKLIYRGLGLYWFRVEQKKEGHKRWTLEAEVPLVLNSTDTPLAEHTQD